MAPRVLSTDLTHPTAQAPRCLFSGIRISGIRKDTFLVHSKMSTHSYLLLQTPLGQRSCHGQEYGPASPASESICFRDGGQHPLLVQFMYKYNGRYR